MRSLLFTSMWNQLSYHCLKNYCKFQMINVPVVSVCKVLCATMECLTAIAAITGWRGLVKSLLSHPIISIFFVHSLSLVLALRILSRRIFPLVLCQKKKKKSHFVSNRDTISLEVCYWGRPKYKYKLRCWHKFADASLRPSWPFAERGLPVINLAFPAKTTVSRKRCFPQISPRSKLIQLNETILQCKCKKWQVQISFFNLSAKNREKSL